MRRRTEPRVAIELPVEVHRDGRLLGTFMTCDVSRAGLGLRTSPATVALPPRALVDAIVHAADGMHRLPALVQHVGARRAGLLLAEDDDVLWATVLERLAGGVAA